MPILSSPKVPRSIADDLRDSAEQQPHRATGSRPCHARLLDGLFRQLVFRQLRRIRDGRIVLIEANARHSFGASEPAENEAVLRVHDPRMYRHLVLGGSIGGAEAFIRGYWDSDDLVLLLGVLSRNPSAAADIERGPVRLLALLRRVAEWFRRNSKPGSRRNIAAHYDLGNEFFASFLDETMTYSCGIFTHPHRSLKEASLAKYERICRKLDLGPSDHLLEIGCGWGGFAVYAAENFGCRVTATTISQRQFEHAQQRVRDSGLQDRVSIVAQDYRQLTGSYDKLVSIEMIEAVGHEYLDEYFKTCCQLLRPDGMMLLQAITIADQHYETYRRRVDFIRQYVFPGGLLPSVEAICRSTSRSTDFRLFHMEDITPHYAQTLACWRQRLHENLPAIRQLDLPQELLRLWEFYFCYCEAGFRTRRLGCVQILFTRQQCRRAPILPRLD